MNAATAARRINYVTSVEAENRRLKGVIASLTRTADEENPAQPVPEPAEQAPAQTTDGATAPSVGTVDVTTPGGVDAVTPAQTVDVASPGGVATVAPATQQDVTAPVAGGTDIPIADVRTEVEVDHSAETLGEPAFASDNSWVQSAQAKRLAAAVTDRNFACLRLARMQIAAGIAQGDDIELGRRLASSNTPNEIIRNEISTLGKVAQQRTPSPKPSVHRTTASSGVRGVPSLVSTASPVDRFPEGSMTPSDDEFVFGL